MSDVFTGHLIGGPDHGNKVTSTVPVIPVRVQSSLWLDGKKPEAHVVVLKEEGSYIWQEVEEYFKWIAENSEVEVV